MKKYMQSLNRGISKPSMRLKLNTGSQSMSRAGETENYKTIDGQGSIQHISISQPSYTTIGGPMLSKNQIV